MLTVKYLLEILKDLPEEMPVIISKDAEGNNYSPLASVITSNCGYVPQCSWAGEIKLLFLDEELRSLGYSEEDLDGKAVPCVLLKPTC